MLPIAHGNFSGQRLVIFGCGYIGSVVARQAIASGFRVTALTQNAEKAKALSQLGIEVVVDDLAGDVWHRKIADGADYILNAVSSGGGGIEGYRHSYLEGMKSILRWAAAIGRVGTLVYTSSTSVYPQDGGVVVDETASTQHATERGQVLLDAEQVLLKPASFSAPVSGGDKARDPFRRFFILRLAGIYGPGRHHLLEQIKAGEVAGNGDHRLNLIHRDDVGAAIWAAFAAPSGIANEIFNVADDGALPKYAVTEWIATRLNIPVPHFSGAAAGSRRTITPDRIISNTKLKNTLGWRPLYPTFCEGYEQILANP
jgi:nucleoside-diphosphate-sugar epimerase